MFAIAIVNVNSVVNVYHDHLEFCVLKFFTGEG